MSARATDCIKLAARAVATCCSGALAAALRRFGLGLAIGPVIEAVASHLPTSVAPSVTKTVEVPAHRSQALTERGVDLSDRRVVEREIHELNIEQLDRPLP